MNNNECKRGTFVPPISGEDLVNDCCPPEGGTKTVGAPQYELVVKNPDEGVEQD